MKKKLISALLCAAMVASLVVGCGGKEEPAAEAPAATEEAEAPSEESAEPVTIRLMHVTSDEVQNKILEEYIKPGVAEKFPNVTIEFEAGGGGTDYENTLKTLSGAGDLPDVWASVSTTSMIPIIEAGNVLELTDYVTADGFIEKFANPDALKDSDGKIYTVSQGTDPMHIPVIFYNKALFEQCGITEEPATWEEFLTVCETLKANGVTPLSLNGSSQASTSQIWFQCTLTSKDPQVALDLIAGKTDWSNPACVEAYTKYNTLMEKGYFNEGYQTTDTATALGLFTEGQVAMTGGMSWNCGSWTEDQVGLFPFPSDSDEYAAGEVISFWGAPYSGYAVNANSENPEVAVQVAEYCAEMAARYFNEQGTTSNLITDVEIAEAAPLLAEVNEISNNAKVLVPYVFSNSMDAFVQSEWWTMCTGFNAGMYTPEEICETFNNDIYSQNTWFE